MSEEQMHSGHTETVEPIRTMTSARLRRVVETARADERAKYAPLLAAVGRQLPYLGNRKWCDEIVAAYKALEQAK